MIKIDCINCLFVYSVNTLIGFCYHIDKKSSDKKKSKLGAAPASITLLCHRPNLCVVVKVCTAAQSNGVDVNRTERERSYCNYCNRRYGIQVV